MAFHPVLSSSPLEKAFCYVATQSSSSAGIISGSVGDGDFLSSSSYRDNGDGEDSDDAEHDLPPFLLSPPEISLLRSAEENPLEYTMAEADDAVSYVRILLKMLEQVTITNQPSQQQQIGSKNPNEEERILMLDTPMFSEDDAFDVYNRSNKQHKRLVVAHYCVTKIYEIICVSLDSDGGIPSVLELFHGTEKDTTPNFGGFDDAEEDEDDPLHTIHLETEEWRFLIKILYNRSSDEYTKRGSALILAFILKAGCERNEKISLATKKAAGMQQSNQQEDEDLLDLFSDEHKTARSPSSASAAPTTTSTNVIEDTLQSLISWLATRLQRSRNYASLGVVTPTLGVLMSTTKQARLAFCQAGGIGYISRHLRAKRQRLPLSSSIQEQLYKKRAIAERSNATTSSSSNNRSVTERTAITIPMGNDSPSALHRRFESSQRFSGAGSPQSRAQQQQFQQLKRKTGNGATGMIIPSLPSTEVIDSMLTTASEAAAKIAQSAPAGLAVLAASTIDATATSTTDPPRTSSQSSSSSVQQLYDLVFCLWCMSLDCATDETLRRHFARDGAVQALGHLLKRVPREKVLRVTLACLRSLSRLDNRNSDSDANFVRDMIGCGILKSLETVQQRRWNDPDLEEDLVCLKDILATRTIDLTQWSAYEAEIATGVLRWDDMLHTQDFFRANAKKMEGRRSDFAPLKRLVDLLYFSTISGKLRISGRADEISYMGLNEVGGWDEEDLRDDEVCESLAVCLFDIGEFARNYPNAKSVLSGGRGGAAKSLIMQYVQHPRDDVREQALLCASKLLVKNWRAIGE